MSTLNQIKVKKKMTYVKQKNKKMYQPQIKGICIKLFTMSPKKPNSAIRKIAKIKLSSGFVIMAYIPGEGHNLQEHALVLVQGASIRDLPGIRYRLIRGALDFSGLLKRRTARSKYGTKKVLCFKKVVL
jgi:small subunit ribosomal protein S12